MTQNPMQSVFIILNSKRVKNKWVFPTLIFLFFFKKPPLRMHFTDR